jgi:SAM-dependent methyltransferase
MTSYENINLLNHAIIPIFELDETGTVKPNPLFHRPWDKLHSRCIEYPFAASQIGNAQCILDVGTVKSDPAWIAWLENLPIEVHATDYDEPIQPFRDITFHQADLRKLPFPDDTFDKILAVSVIEHIGLHSPQVLKEELPEYSIDGDVQAVHELVRVLKKGGELIMTIPFGSHEGLILGNEARNYTPNSIKKFKTIAEPVLLHYYEYQYSSHRKIYTEYAFSKSLLQRLHDRISRKFIKHISQPNVAVQPDVTVHPSLSGIVTWRRIPMENAEAIHHRHVEGVLCAVWRKR